MFTLVKLGITILVIFKLIPKSKLVSQHEFLLLEDELVQLNKINLRQAADFAKIRKDFTNIEKQYQELFLSEQQAKKELFDSDTRYVELVLKLENRIKKLHKEKEEAEAAEDVATQQYLALQADATAATELSMKLKEALIKWMS